MSVSWDYYDKFKSINDKYLPPIGEGETKATQLVTAINKLIYKWYNDGDVFDNTHHLSGWANDISSFANWMGRNVKGAGRILAGISECQTSDEYEDLLKDLADRHLDEELLAELDREATIGTVYKCPGPFKFIEEDY